MKYVNEQGVAFGLLSKEDQEYIKGHPDREFYKGSEWAPYSSHIYSSEVWRAPAPVEKTYRPLTADEYHGEPIRNRNGNGYAYTILGWGLNANLDSDGIDFSPEDWGHLKWKELADNWEYYKDGQWQRMRVICEEDAQ